MDVTHIEPNSTLARVHSLPPGFDSSRQVLTRQRQRDSLFALLLHALRRHLCSVPAYFRPACSKSRPRVSSSPVTFGSAVPGLPPPSAIRFLALVRPSFFHSDWLDLGDTRFTIYHRH
ncbi:hypothetical protein Forpe1208_v001266 [Fusarium oxysporum f. sp. rapae]|uniref:Uncharacterized protein n=1 Tax=Fusarium oxysporum f. sp. rapae TaxID=485398 RepID=A0A8J5PEY9_FUSOX|nr:hypothetical protein Forpe1208_v001266 [Fusarium oxysporum f. sp. rapae]